MELELHFIAVLLTKLDATNTLLIASLDPFLAVLALEEVRGESAERTETAVRVAVLLGVFDARRHRRAPGTICAHVGRYVCQG